VGGPPPGAGAVSRRGTPWPAGLRCGSRLAGCAGTARRWRRISLSPAGRPAFRGRGA